MTLLVANDDLSLLGADRGRGWFAFVLGKKTTTGQQNKNQRVSHSSLLSVNSPLASKVTPPSSLLVFALGPSGSGASYS